MFDKFLGLISQYHSLSKEETDLVRDQFPIKSFKKNEIIFNEGRIAKSIYFVLEGFVRLFYTSNGKDKTAFFYTEGQFFCANESFLKKTPANENFQALENTTLLIIHKSIDTEMIKKFPTFGIIERLALIEELVTSNRMIESFVSKSPEERYLNLLKTNQDLFQRVDQQHIASYLGISPESLSRIKKRILTSSN